MIKENTILSANNLAVGYKTPLIKDISFSCERGELVALAGKNGSGKSTLLKTLSGLHKRISGDIIIEGTDIQNISIHEKAKYLSFVAASSIVSNISVIETISLGRYPYTGVFGKLSARDKYIIDQVVDRINIKHLLNKKLYEISDGEKQKVMIARSLVQDTPVIILDEPTAYLDIHNRFEIMLLLKDIAEKENKCVLFSSHDLDLAIRFSVKMLFITDYKIIQGAPEDLVINGTFEKMINIPDVGFSYQNADFVYTKPSFRTICLKGEGLAFDWTLKSLEKEGIKCECNNSDSDYVIINDFEKDKTIWVYHNKNQKLVFGTIYDLKKFLINH